jgi:UDP-N-acetylmuramate--alanine ligase
LAKLAKDAGYGVFGSDSTHSNIIDELKYIGVDPVIGQTGNYLEEVFVNRGIDWFVHTSALPNDHSELLRAKKLGIKTTKRDTFLSQFITDHGFKLIAVAGTHGKTTTTSMLVWALLQLQVPISYIVGTSLSFAQSGHYQPGSKYFIYEADEYDRNFLKFHPYISLIPSVSYDHVDIYPTRQSYIDAFKQFISQSKKTYMWRNSNDELAALKGVRVISDPNPGLTLPGVTYRANASLALKAIADISTASQEDILRAVNSFPGAHRRFEKLADNLYSDYAHHPDEIAATLQMAKELSKKVAVVYQPHQNTRQHEVKYLYKDAFKNADKVFWLPTYLAREDPSLATLSPVDLIKKLANPEVAQTADLNDKLQKDIKKLLSDDYLVVLMSAGPADDWLRKSLGKL